MANKQQRHVFLMLLTITQVIVVRCEENVFKIRKCCAENELILEKTSECTEFKLLKMNNHIYHVNNSSNVNSSDSAVDSIDLRPWWFPPNKRIISKKTNETLRRFPKKLEVMAGEGQPCDILETAYLTLDMSQYDFFDDGSIIVYPNHTVGFYTQKVEIIFDPLTFCVDRYHRIFSITAYFNRNILPSGIFLMYDFAVSRASRIPELTNFSKRFEMSANDEKEDAEPTLDFFDPIDYLIMLCPCKKATCVLKCCPPGMLIDVENAFDRENACVRNEPEEGDWTPNYTKVGSDSPDYFILHRFPVCKPEEGAVIPNQFKMDGHTIFSNGSAHILGETHMSGALEFCGENFIIGPGNPKIYNHLVRCYPEVGIKNRDSEIRRILYGILFVIASVFLFLTLLVHGLLPARNNINDKNLISQTWSLFVGYVCIAVSQLGINDLPQNACIFLGFLIQYSFLAAFFWLNVLCFDISWTFSELRIIRGIPHERTHRKFFYYSIYCWLSPAVISIVTAIIEFSPSIPEHLVRPQIKERCWFKHDSTAILAYFYGPIAVLLSMNVIMFLFTLYRIYQAQKDISTVIKNTNPEKQRFILYVKLLILMGLPWIAELISWVVGGPNYYWYLTDIINLLRAVFIFAVFCCKKQVMDELKRKFGIIRKPHIGRPSIPRTSSSFFASTQSQDLPKCSNNAVSSL